MREKFGARARILALPNIDGRKADWTEYLLPKQDRRGFDIEHPYAGHDASDVLRLMSIAAGKRIHSVAEAGAAFRTYRATNTGLQTGWHQLDAAIAPGLLPGQIVFILAKTGAGKTLILCNLAYQMRKHRILFISLEMTREEVYHRLQRVYWHHHPDASTQELEYALSNVWICDENRLGERDLQALINEYAMETGTNPDIVFVDYLGYYARGARGNSPYEKTTNAAMQLKADAKAGRLVIISPAQVNRLAKDGKPIDLDDARDSGAVEETGDFVIAAYRSDAALSEGIVNAVPTWKLMLTLLKSRHGGVGKTVQLQMDALTLALCEVGTRGARIAEEHNILFRRGKTWDALRAEQTAPRQLSMRTDAS
jgi:archaellum biogenesis ATPase FlaH